MKRVALASVLTSVLACAPSAWHRYRDEGATLVFPTEPDVRRVREGPWADATVVSARDGGVTYELARFVLTTIPDESQRAALLAEVERGLSARHGVSGTEASAGSFQGRQATRMVVSFEDGAAAHFVVFYRDERTLVELSVFGSAPGLEHTAERFFAGYSTGASGPSSTDRGASDVATQ